jgi:hypothetical protein
MAAHGDTRRVLSGFVFSRLLLILPLLIGCSGTDKDLGEVTGLVSLDGLPLADATVEFHPVETGRSSPVSVTDAAGRYRLYQHPGKPGAQPGDYLVVISKPVETDTEEGERETLLPRYNERTELRRSVKLGANALDFDLQSK